MPLATMPWWKSLALMNENLQRVSAIAVLIFHNAAETLGDKPGDDVRINPLGISLQPDRWKRDGLLSAPGISLREARELVPGFEQFFLDERGA
jgi:hypothetical protein